jgi:hypothetical protein
MMAFGLFVVPCVQHQDRIDVYWWQTSLQNHSEWMRSDVLIWHRTTSTLLYFLECSFCNELYQSMSTIRNTEINEEHCDLQDEVLYFDIIYQQPIFALVSNISIDTFTNCYLRCPLENLRQIDAPIPTCDLSKKLQIDVRSDRRLVKHSLENWCMWCFTRERNLDELVQMTGTEESESI